MRTLENMARFKNLPPDGEPEKPWVPIKGEPEKPYTPPDWYKPYPRNSKRTGKPVGRPIQRPEPREGEAEVWTDLMDAFALSGGLREYMRDIKQRKREGVTQLMRWGWSQKQIAEELGLSLWYVRDAVNR